MDVRGFLGLWLSLGLVSASAQVVDLKLPDPPEASALASAVGLTEAQAESARAVLMGHREGAQAAYLEFQQSRYKALVTSIGSEAMEKYEDFRLKGQAFTPGNAAYRTDSQQRRVDSGEAGGADASVNLLTRESVAELATAGVIDETQAQALLAELGSFRTQREALYARWDAEKDALLVSAALGLSESQRAGVIEADRLVMRFALMQQRRDEGQKLLREPLR